MARIAVFIDHDILIRHFVLNRVLAPLSGEHRVVYVFPAKHKRVRMDLEALGPCLYRTVPVSEERAYLYRRLYHATVLKQLRGTGDYAIVVRFWRDALGRKAFLESWFYSWRLTYQYYQKKMLARVGEDRELSVLLAAEEPDILLHPTVLEGLFVGDLLRWGKDHGTPTVFVMNSWDNPATKAMIMGYPTRLVVWGEQTRQHAIGHMGMPPERIACLGAAQFDVFRKSPKEDAEGYRRRLGIPAGRKVLLYAGSSKGLNETQHLVALDHAIERGDLSNCVVLYRPHPWRAYPEGEPDFCSLTWRHVLLEPSMEACYKSSRGADRIRVDLANYEDTHTALNAVNAVISPLSTILLEAALHGKPVGAYLPDEDMKSNKFLFAAANMAHFREFFERVDCVKCESADRLVEDCRRLLEKTDEPGIDKKLKKQCEYFVTPSDRPYADRLNELIRCIVSDANRRTIQHT